MRPRSTQSRCTHLLFALTAALLPALLHANGSHADGPPIRRTGAPVDGGLTCTACHRTGADTTGGKVDIRVLAYKPGVKQNIRVRVEHPAALRWGFELTARLAGDPTRKAGTFTITDLIRVRCDDAALRGVAGPCADDKTEFAAHMPAATTMGSNGRMDFMVEWTPPASDVGDIIFYAAGNAADNSGDNTGDRIYTTSKTIPYDWDCTSTTKPTITGVINAASGSATLSGNAMMSIFGTGFTPAGRKRIANPGEPGLDDSGDDSTDDKFPSGIGCVEVYVEDESVPLTYISENQINAQIPALANMQGGNVRVKVEIKSGDDNLESDDKMVPYQTVNPAFFTFNGTSIAGLTAQSAILADPAVVPGGVTAKAGDIVVLFGTGWGPTEPSWDAGVVVPTTGPALPRLRSDMVPSVTIGGTTLAASDILYIGLSPGSISGLYQLNVKLPASAATGEVPVTLAVNGVSSQAGATIPIR